MAQDENNMESETLASLELRKKRLEVSKLERENKKLQIEEAELAKPWYKKPIWYSSLGPLFIGLFTVYIAFETNIFGVQKLQKEKEQLDITIKSQKDSIQTAKVTLQGLGNDVEQEKKANTLILDSIARVKEIAIQSEKSLTKRINEMRRRKIDDDITAANSRLAILKSQVTIHRAAIDSLTYGMKFNYYTQDEVNDEVKLLAVAEREIQIILQKMREMKIKRTSIKD